MCGEAHYVGKDKTKFQYRFNNCKSKQSFKERQLKNTLEMFS